MDQCYSSSLIQHGWYSSQGQQTLSVDLLDYVSQVVMHIERHTQNSNMGQCYHSFSFEIIFDLLINIMSDVSLVAVEL